MSEKVEETMSPEQISTGIIFVGAQHTPSLYAHHFMAQEDDNDIVLSFFETSLPFIPVNEEAKKKAIEEIKEKGITAECVAKIRIGKQKFPLFLSLVTEMNDRIFNEWKKLAEKYGVDPTNDSEN